MGRKVGISDQELLAVVAEMIGGLVDANLGGQVFKKRIGISGRGKSGGARVVLATNGKDRWFFLYGFLKNQRAAMSSNELQALRELTRDLLALSEAQIHEQTEIGALEEIHERPEQ